ncbi:cytochrome c oxidase assembly protein [Thalassotalea ponticola]|uniref:cytochrome c oxidase assembly protein n=1 Tax=Thalassotalea ponticola TaxID=1523392 RepID=UPI0025B4E7CF|nr:cytochrome c oxidase assembly protein [Thalassotalea ponticola]MDN3652282.1 cytochrome c oxidase assembly protein [Thalassotalea ponticola]
MNPEQDLQNQQNDANKSQHKQVKQSVTKLMLIVLGMFGFGFALVPLYDVFCDITGLNGKTATTAAVVNDSGIDTSRTVKVQFMSRTAQGAPWQFEPEMNAIEVHPGEMKLVKFYAKNESGRYAVAQAIPSVSPGQAANYFQKIECFCFNQQPLEANTDVWMPLQFYVDVDLPEDVSELTLSYTLYDITDRS